MARGVSLFLGGWLALATVAALHRPAFDLAVWCVDTHPLPAALRIPALSVAAALLVAFALSPRAARFRRRATLAALALLGALALRDTIAFYVLWHAGAFRPGNPLPLSLVVLGALLLVARAAARGEQTPARRVAFTTLACALAFPVLQMLCFGDSDYRRPADAALVFGARAYADGSASPALEDRVRTACVLYHQGLVRLLILSGGKGDGAVSEPQAMRRVALAAGVPDSALVLDGAGVSTEASVDDARAIATRDDLHRIIAVSHAYHLPRVKLELQRVRLASATVPAHQTDELTGMPWFVTREVAAWWLHVLDLSV